MAIKRIPIVYIENEHSANLRSCLLQAVKYNAESPIYVILDRASDVSLQGRNFQHLYLQDYFTDAAEFKKIYQHMSPKSEAYELFRLQRWFVLREFMKFFQLSVVFFCESTVLLYDDISRLYENNWREKTVLCVHEKNINTSAGYWKYEDVCRFCELIVDEYRDHLDILQHVFGHMAQLGGFHGDNDCVLLWKFFHQSNFKDSLTDIIEGATFDYDFGSAAGRRSNDYVMDGAVKKLEWRNNQPYAVHVANNAQVQLATLHFSESVRTFLPSYYELHMTAETRKALCATTENSLSDYFRKQKTARHWWFQLNEASTSLPPLYSILSTGEQEIIKEWFKATDNLYSKLDRGPEESGIPVLSFLQGLIMGNNISKIVECGTNYGYATLLLGIMQKKMQNRNSLFTVDIEQFKTDFAKSWATRAGLGEYVKLHTGDSASPETAKEALNYLSGEIELVFIDSSHVYSHTIRELETWYPLVKSGGFIVLHDANFYYHQQVMKAMPQSGGGVFRALTEWREIRRVPVMILNNFLGPTDKGPDTKSLVYKDAVGLALIQKQW